jgi:hypothetical protein
MINPLHDPQRFLLIPSSHQRLLKIAPVDGIKRTMDSLRVLLVGLLLDQGMYQAPLMSDDMIMATLVLLQPLPPQSVRMSRLRNRHAPSQKSGLEMHQLALFPRIVMSKLSVRFQKKESELNPLTEVITYQEVPRKIDPLPMGGLIVKIMEDHRHTLLVSQYGNQQ